MVASLMLLIAAMGKIFVANRIKPIELAHKVAPHFPMTHSPGGNPLPQLQMQRGADEANVSDAWKPEGPGQSWRANNGDVPFEWRSRLQSLVEVSKSDAEASAKTKLLPRKGPRLPLHRSAARHSAISTFSGTPPIVSAGQNHSGPLARLHGKRWWSARGRFGHRSPVTVMVDPGNSNEIDDGDLLTPQASSKNGTLASEFVASKLEDRRARLLAELSDVDRALEANANVNAQQRKATAPQYDRGSATAAFEPSFGYLSRSAGVYTEAVSDGGASVPTSAFDLAIRNFKRELPEFLKALDRSSSDADQIIADDSSDDAVALRAKLDTLVLSNEAVWAREKLRPPVSAPLILLGPYYVLCWVLDNLFDGRPLSRFWFLETVARMPYFSYVSTLHLYESLGWWRRSAGVKRVHFAEEWNEFHHLLIMESLGADQLWRDRFCAQHSAIIYYWLLVGLWFLSPSLAYNFSELIEAHAVDTYGEFVDANRETLAELPAPKIAKLYYAGPDLFYFDEFQTSRIRGSRRPPCDTLLDVFTNIRDDEGEHVSTMAACQDPTVSVNAPRVEQAILASAFVGVAAYNLLTGDSVDGLTDAVQDVEGLTVAVKDADAIEDLGESFNALWVYVREVLSKGWPKV